MPHGISGSCGFCVIRYFFRNFIIFAAVLQGRQAGQGRSEGRWKPLFSCLSGRGFSGRRKRSRLARGPDGKRAVILTGASGCPAGLALYRKFGKAAGSPMAGMAGRPVKRKLMIDKRKVKEILQAFLEQEAGSGLFEVSVSVSPKNEIKIYLDGMQGVDIEACVAASRFVESRLDREEEDFELTVSSAGLDQPFRVPAQYLKNKGREVKVSLRGGQTLKGEILDADDTGFLLAETGRKKGSSKASGKKKAKVPAPGEDAAEAGETPDMLSGEKRPADEKRPGEAGRVEGAPCAGEGMEQAAQDGVLRIGYDQVKETKIVISFK